MHVCLCVCIHCFNISFMLFYYCHDYYDCRFQMQILFWSVFQSPAWKSLQLVINLRSCTEPNAALTCCPIGAGFWRQRNQVAVSRQTSSRSVRPPDRFPAASSNSRRAKEVTEFAEILKLFFCSLTSDPPNNKVQRKVHRSPTALELYFALVSEAPNQTHNVLFSLLFLFFFFFWFLNGWFPFGVRCYITPC